MIKVLPESKGNILVLRAVAKLTDQNYKDVLIPLLESIFREHGKARLLLDMGTVAYSTAGTVHPMGGKASGSASLPLLSPLLFLPQLGLRISGKGWRYCG